METNSTPEQDALAVALERKLLIIFSEAELLRGISTPEANKLAIISYLVFSNHYTLEQAEVAHNYILNKDFTKWRANSGLEKQDFYPSHKELQEMQKSGDIYFCRRSHQDKILQEVYRSAKHDAGMQEYERGKRDGIKEACEASPELKALYNDETLATLKKLNDGLQQALYDELDQHHEQEASLRRLHKELEAVRNTLSVLVTHTETYFAEGTRKEERMSAQEDIQNDIARAKRLLLGDDTRRSSAIAPVNEETGAFDELPPVEYTKIAPAERVPEETTPLPGTLGSILQNVSLASLNMENQERISKKRAVQNGYALEYEREAA